MSKLIDLIIKERYTTIKELSQVIDKILIPTKNEQAINAEVSTPYFLRQKMLDTIPKDFWVIENHIGDCVKNSEERKVNTVLEPTCGKGGFVVDIIERFWNANINNQNVDILYIIENCIYFSDINPENIDVCRFLVKECISLCGGKFRDINWWLGNALELDIKKQWNIDKFSLVIGNPPYNVGSQSTSKTIYQYFVEKFIDNTKYLCFVIPSRWFACGKGLDKFRERMLKRKDIRYVFHTNNSSEWFGKIVKITGGCNYFLKDSSYNGLCNFSQDNNSFKYDFSKYDVIILPKYYDVIDKILTIKNKMNFESLDTIYLPTSYYKVSSNDKRFKDKTLDDDVLCHVSYMKNKDRIRYIAKKDIEIPDERKVWKVVSPRCQGQFDSGIGHLTVSLPTSVFTHTYYGFRCNNESECNSLISFLNCQLPNNLLNARKTTPHISKTTFKWIPLPPLDRTWSNEKILEYYGY